ncbi:integrase catalytic domain-containing protein [Trichonephila clavipes]|nr:integrase catalytic domain-containing protein [Trichonephila clavipes]
MGLLVHPYLATRTIQQLARDEGEHYPLAASVTIRDIYMDDILTGSSDFQEFQKLQLELISLFKKAGMSLHKWCSNTPEILNSIPKEQSWDFHCQSSDQKTIKTLGIIWSPQFDYFSFKTVVNCRESYTKREVLSNIARLFDPLGFLGPILTKAKLILQKLWVLKLEWDKPLSNPIAKEWNDFVSTLPVIKIYPCPSTRNRKRQNYYPWICRRLNSSMWCCTICSIDLRGGCIYKTLVQQIPCCTGETNHYSSFGIVCFCVIVTAPGKDDLSKHTHTRSNNYTKLLHILSYIFRFLHNSRNPSVKRSGQLDYSEVNEAELCLIKNLQASAFQEEIEFLAKSSCNSKKGKLFSLNPFLDGNQILRVGGRLQNSNLTYSQKHPTILPADHLLTKLIMINIHNRNFHLGPQALLYCTRQRFWPLRGRSIARKIVHECVVCFKNKPIVANCDIVYCREFPSFDKCYGFTSWSRTSASPIDCP